MKAIKSLINPRFILCDYGSLKYIVFGTASWRVDDPFDSTGTNLFKKYFIY